MDGPWPWVFYEHLVVRCNFNVVIGFVASSSIIYREMRKLPQILPKNMTVPHLERWRNQTAQRMKMGKHCFERGIIALHFSENTQVSLYPFLRNRGALVQVSFKRGASVSRFMAIRQMSPPASSVFYTVSQKKQDTKLLPITSPNVNRFSKFFHWQTHW